MKLEGVDAYHFLPRVLKVTSENGNTASWFGSITLEANILIAMYTIFIHYLL